jgi:hypothetical protein
MSLTLAVLTGLSGPPWGQLLVRQNQSAVEWQRAAELQDAVLQLRMNDTTLSEVRLTLPAHYSFIPSLAHFNGRNAFLLCFYS